MRGKERGFLNVDSIKNGGRGEIWTPDPLHPKQGSYHSRDPAQTWCKPKILARPPAHIFAVRKNTLYLGVWEQKGSEIKKIYDGCPTWGKILVGGMKILKFWSWC